MIADQKFTTQHFLIQAIFWGCGALLIAAITTGLLTDPMQTTFLLALGIIVFANLKNQHSGLYLVLLLPVIGELVRLPLGPADSVLVSDAVIPLVIVAWLFSNLSGRQDVMPRSRLTTPFTIFIVVAALSLIQSLAFLAPAEVFSGSLYLIRYIQYGLLFFVTIQNIQTPQQARTIIRFMVASTLLLALAGFVQLAVYPDLAALEEAGYDPHINRLVSTWLDPNFVGGLFAFTISILLGITLNTKKHRTKIGLLTLMGILAVALFLTYSRSAYLALAAGVFIVSLFQSRKILVITLVLFLAGIAVSDRAQERVGELMQSASSILFSQVDTPDPTAKLRIQSWQQTWHIIEQRPLLGSGYNTLRSVNYQEGFIKDTDTHSGSGSDSSLLTILATTGIFGLTPFLLLYLIPLKTAFTSWRDQKIPAYFRGYSLGFLGGIVALLIHSVFVNSLLFPSILLFVWIGLGILERVPSLR